MSVTPNINQRKSAFLSARYFQIAMNSDGKAKGPQPTAHSDWESLYPPFEEVVVRVQMTVTVTDSRQPSFLTFAANYMQQSSNLAQD